MHLISCAFRTLGLLSRLVRFSSIPFGDLGGAPFGAYLRFPRTKVIVGNVEVYRTKVIPMTLSPVWNESFFVSPKARSSVADSADPADADSDAGGVRFEIWDHDLHGKGDYLGTLPPVVVGVRLALFFFGYDNMRPRHTFGLFFLSTHVWVVAYDNGG